MSSDPGGGAVGLFERLASDAQDSPTLGAFRYRLVEAVQARVGAESASIVDPVWGPVAPSDANRIAGWGVNVGYEGQFLANQRRYAVSLRRFLRLIRRGPRIDTDVYGARERRRLAAYAELFLPQGANSILASAVHFRGRALAIVVLKRHGRSRPFRARDAKSLERLLPAIGLAEAGFQYGAEEPSASRRGCAGRASLSPRETQVAHLVGRGMRNAEVAALLGTSCETVKKQVRSVIEKVGVSNRTELAMVWATSDGSRSTND